MSALNFDLELQALKERSVDRLLMADAFDRPAFEQLLDGLEARAESFKSEYALPKQFLSYLRTASQAMRSRADYLPEVHEALDLANKFDLLLDLSVIGECLNDRAQGRPRIV